MSAACKECGGVTQWEQEVGSRICTECGTLEDSSQQVLDSHLDPCIFGDDAYHRQRSNPLATSAPLKSLRHAGWDLTGQNEGRHRRNMLAMQDYINSIASRLGYVGQVERAKHLFTLLMERGKLRWGRKARLMAGAALAIALRESNKLDCLRDIGLFVGEPTSAVARAFTSAATLLSLSVTSADASTCIPSLVAHISSILDSDHLVSEFTIPLKLRTMLANLRPRLASVQQTAILLSALFTRLQTFVDVPVPPTACALFLLALEAESATSLPNSTELATVLGVRFQVAGSTIQSRYKLAYDIVEDWIRDVPWLKSHEHRVLRGARGVRKISKLSKRSVVAQGLKDAVHFQDEIWKKKVDLTGWSQLTLEYDEEQENIAESRVTVQAGIKKRGLSHLNEANAVVQTLYSRKKRKTTLKPVEHASTFLLDPLSAKTSSKELKQTMVFQEPAPSVQNSATILSHFLSVHPMEMSLNAPPTRLQLLASERGGSDASVVPDDELFEDGELEGLLRTEDEMKIVRQLFASQTPQAAAPFTNINIGDRIDASTTGSGLRGVDRINVNSFRRLLGEDFSESELQQESPDTADLPTSLPDVGFYPDNDKMKDYNVTGEEEYDWSFVPEISRNLDDTDWYEF